ncbi:MAG: TolC family outer membrane protein [Burkholderiaceae bacterium]
MSKRLSAICTAAVLLSAGGAAKAQQTGSLREAAERAIATHPDVSARFNAYRASIDATTAARAAFLPRIDLNASVGKDSDRISGRNPTSQTLTRSSVGASLSQLLWDGLSTQNEVLRLNHDQLARYFELVDTTEQVALESARAHYDVMRMRHLVQIAEDNYVQHRYAHLQIQSRVKAGVGRGVDLEQAAARLALAESNLSTESSNLHDVSARYQRIVGEDPPPKLASIVLLERGVPSTASEAMSSAVQRNASISASIENLRAARAQVASRQAAYQPRAEARLRTNAGHHVDGVRDQSRDSTAEIVLNWNLYSGGADQARIRQQAHLLNQASDQRDRACRDVRQNAAIAFNDTLKLKEQLGLLERNSLAIEKARDAYRQQFDIGQRSLLDVLNSESELYTAKRAYVNAEHDLAVAYARAHAAMNQLSAQLGLRSADPLLADAAAWTQGDDAPVRCNVNPTALATTDRSELDARARGMAEGAPAGPPARKP